MPQPDRPHFASDWPTLARVAARIHADRAAALTPEDPRIATMAAVAAIAEAIRENRPIAPAATGWAAIRADLAATARRATERSLARSGDLQAQETAQALAAIAWHFAPVSPTIDTPQIVFCHTTTLAIRARIAAERVEASAPALPRAARPRSPQAGPLFGAAA